MSHSCQRYVFQGDPNYELKITTSKIRAGQQGECMAWSGGEFALGNNLFSGYTKRFSNVREGILGYNGEK